MSEISPKIFHYFRSLEWNEVNLAIQNHEGIDQVKIALIDYLAEWNNREWIDWEKIEFVMYDLDRIDLWKVLPYQKFLTEAKLKVSDEIVVKLRELPY